MSVHDRNNDNLTHLESFFGTGGFLQNTYPMGTLKATEEVLGYFLALSQRQRYSAERMASLQACTVAEVSIDNTRTWQCGKLTGPM